MKKTKTPKNGDHTLSQYKLVDMTLSRTKLVKRALVKIDEIAERVQYKIDEIVLNLAPIMDPIVPTSLKYLWELELKTQGKIDEIVQNLALIMYPTAPANLKPHWKRKLMGHLIDLTVGNTEKVRRYVFSKVIKMYDITEVRHKHFGCMVKFEEENLKAEEEWFESVNDKMNEHIRTLFEFCAKRQYEQLHDYIQAL